MGGEGAGKTGDGKRAPGLCMAGNGRARPDAAGRSPVSVPMGKNARKGRRRAFLQADALDPPRRGAFSPVLPHQWRSGGRHGRGRVRERQGTGKAGAGGTGQKLPAVLGRARTAPADLGRGPFGGYSSPREKRVIISMVREAESGQGGMRERSTHRASASSEVSRRMSSGPSSSAT